MLEVPGVDVLRHLTGPLNDHPTTEISLPGEQRKLHDNVHCWTRRRSMMAAIPDPRRWQALALVCVAFFMTVLDVSIVTVACRRSSVRSTSRRRGSNGC